MPQKNSDGFCCILIFLHSLFLIFLACIFCILFYCSLFFCGRSPFIFIDVSLIVIVIISYMFIILHHIASFLESKIRLMNIDRREEKKKHFIMHRFIISIFQKYIKDLIRNIFEISVRKVQRLFE